MKKLIEWVIPVLLLTSAGSCLGLATGCQFAGKGDWAVGTAGAELVKGRYEIIEWRVESPLADGMVAAAGKGLDKLFAGLNPPPPK